MVEAAEEEGCPLLPLVEEWLRVQLVVAGEVEEAEARFPPVPAPEQVRQEHEVRIHPR